MGHERVIMGFKTTFDARALPPEGWNRATLTRIEDAGTKKSKETGETHHYLKFSFHIELPDASATITREISDVIIANDPRSNYQDSEYYKLLTRGFGIVRKRGAEFDTDEIEGRPLQVMVAWTRKKDARGREKIYARVTDYRTDRPDVLNVTVVPAAVMQMKRQARQSRQSRQARRTRGGR